MAVEGIKPGFKNVKIMVLQDAACVKVSSQQF